MSRVTDLKHCRKADLQKLAEELGVDFETGDTIPKLIRKIEAAEDYEKEFALSQIRNIISDREDQLQRENLEREDKIREQEFVLEQQRLTQNAGRRSSTSSSNSENSHKLSLKSIMHKFDAERSDITLFLNLFERQARRSEIDEGDYVTHLLSLLPVDIAELILREPEEKIDDFSHVKSILLERFKLNHEVYRQKFIKHPKNPSSPWKDLIFELNSFLDGWLKGLSVDNFQDLKKLLVTNEIKKRASSEMKEHFLDSWANFTDPAKLAACLDDYEAIKGSAKKLNFPKYQNDRKFEKPRLENKTRYEERQSPSKINWREKDVNKEREKFFESRRINKCFICGSSKHLKANCPEYKKHKIS